MNNKFKNLDYTPYVIHLVSFLVRIYKICKYLTNAEMLRIIVKCSMSSFILMCSQMGSFACYSELNLFRKVLFHRKKFKSQHILLLKNVKSPMNKNHPRNIRMTLRQDISLSRHASWGWCSSCERILNDLCSVYKILLMLGSIQ